MNKFTIIEELARDKTIENITRNVGGSDDDLKDLCQDLYIDLLSKDDELIIKLYESKQLKFFVTKMVLNNLHSKNSPFFTQYRKNNNNKVEITDRLSAEI